MIDAIETKTETRKLFARFKGHADELIPILQAVQERFGYLPEIAMIEVSKFAKVPESSVFGVSTFYALFKTNPVGKHTVKVCRGTACHVRGSLKILEEIEKQLGIKAGETREDMEWSIDTISCFGSCALAPVMVVDKKVYGRMTPAMVKETLAEAEKPAVSP